MANSTNLTHQPESLALAIPVQSDDPDTIRRQIDHTRAQLGTTIQAISERLSPDYLIEQAKSSAREATVGRLQDMKHQANRKVEGMSNGISQTVRDNPLPVAIIGLGLGWLLLSERNKRDAYLSDDYRYAPNDYRYYDYPENRRGMRDGRERVENVASAVGHKAAEVKERVGNTVNEATDSVSNVASRAGDAVSEAGERVGDKLSDGATRVSQTVSTTAERVGETAEMVQERASEAAVRARNEAERVRREAEWRARRTAYRTKQSFWQNMEENPLAVGAVLAVAGAAVGAAIPTTDYENKLMGDTRDRLLDEAKVRAQDVVERVQTVVEDTQRAAVTEAKQAVRQQNLTIDDSTETKDNPF
jgi:ElaB/YqjD/DUF883 family membrane-anchored ribosome-binding protein